MKVKARREEKGTWTGQTGDIWTINKLEMSFWKWEYARQKDGATAYGLLKKEALKGAVQIEFKERMV